MTEMKALYFDGALKLLDEYTKPEPGPGEALIKVSLAGICNTDIEIARGYMGFLGVPGHEFVGTVERSENADFVGRRVVGEINCACNTCRYCAGGKSNHCPNRTVLGILNRDGAFAEYLVLPESNLHVVPEAVPDDEAVFVEPLAAACRVTEQVDVSPDQNTVVLGDGKLGLLVSQVLKTRTDNVLLVGRHDEKLDIARRWGVRTEKSGENADRADVVVECTGSAEGVAQALKMLRPMGTLVLKTTVAGTSALPASELVVNEITLVGSRCGPFAEALRLLERNAVDVGEMISARYRIEDGVAAFEHAKRRDALKVLIEM